MKFTSIIQGAAKWLVVASFLSFGFAMSQTEPTLNQVYATAQAGKMDQAQVMMQQVLVAHPNSAKAHFVQAELFSRQGNLGKAREALATAEKLSPGLAFAKPEAVQALRAQLAAKSAAPPARSVAPVRSVVPDAPSSSSSWGLPLLLTGVVLVAGYFIFRRRVPRPYDQQPGYANQDGMSGPQTFGMGGGVAGGALQPGYGQPGYGQPGYGQPGYGQPAGSGIGGRIMGGVATGLAVGAGVMAAEAIGRNLMGNHNQPANAVESAGNNDFQTLERNPDMGGQNFGVNDASSWDDGGSVDIGGGGGDWDN
jgi:hypothetical protein